MARLVDDEVRGWTSDRARDRRARSRARHFTRRAASRRVFRHARDVLSGVGLRAGRARRALARATARKRPSRCRRGCPRARRREPPSAPSTPRPSRVRGGCGSRRASPLDIAIVGAGFAGVATAWHVVHLLATDGDGDAAPTASAVDPAVPAVPRRPVRLRLFDEKGIAGGASGVAAGLLHPYTPRGKIIWRGVEGVAATLRLVDAAEAAERALDAGHAHLPPDPTTATARRGRAIAWRKGTVRPARNAKQARDLARHAPAAAEAGGRGVSLDADALRRLLPGIRVPAEVERGDDADDADDTDDTAKASTLKNGARSARQEREAREAAEARAPRLAPPRFTSPRDSSSTRAGTSPRSGTPLASSRRRTPSPRERPRRFTYEPSPPSTTIRNSRRATPSSSRAAPRRNPSPSSPPRASRPRSRAGTSSSSRVPRAKPRTLRRGTTEDPAY